MPTEKQLIANRQNSQLAGVKTEEGKKIVRHNAFKHGMTAQSLLSKVTDLEETQETFTALVDGLAKSLHPNNELEFCLIENMAKAVLKLRRCDVLEAQMLQDRGHLRLHAEDEIYSGSLGQLDLVLRYKGSLEAQFYKSLEAFHRNRHMQQLDLFGKGGGAS